MAKVLLIAFFVFSLAGPALAEPDVAAQVRALNDEIVALKDDREWLRGKLTETLEQGTEIKDLRILIEKDLLARVDALKIEIAELTGRLEKVTQEGALMQGEIESLRLEIKALTEQHFR